VLKRARKAQPAGESLRSGTALVDGRRVVFGIVEPGFLDGTFGCVAAERLCRVFERALTEKVPALVVTSGGALRHQEGMLALSQANRVTAARQALAVAGVAFVSVLAAPPPRGAALSFAYSGDVNLAEPAVLVTPEAAEDPTRPDELLQRGLVDRVVPRAALKAEIAHLLRLLSGE
jgi:acetyl-CoA carboxylase carboxyl transferase subunit beta